MLYNIAIAICGLIIIFCLFFYFLNMNINTTDKNIEIFIESYDNINIVETKLIKNRIIRSALFFKIIFYLFIFYKNKNINYKIFGGNYIIKPNTSIFDFIKKITNKYGAEEVLVALIPGKRLTYYFNQLKNNNDLTNNYKEFSDIDAIDKIMKKLKIKEPYEGWFFPDTYSFYYGATIEEVFIKSKKKMEKIEKELFKNKKDPFKSFYEVIILASIIEKECGDNDHKDISEVFINRLNKEMKLQSDATVIYGLGDNFKGNLRKQDLKNIVNPYNTYTNEGLPPGAISSVSKKSLEAALNPSYGKYLYFVPKGDKSNKHVFAFTLKEHNKNVKEYRKNIK